ncbi:hypothetical protein GGI64_005117 [Rhizobium leguminosarum]|uniref:Uncharacterized protein n=1 Tax=Rhizobium leguminosarum TaxID=384 RepID=A0A7W9ZUZ3_RHILE|nr:hypothetical protein [Rhizobium leguminosarum]MBB6223296.1 hypothetical protein [Rhizobium leguminosarum]NYJ14026.1 hypothetical protein [Rhizobium leguminosarum]
MATMFKRLVALLLTGLIARTRAIGRPGQR